MVLHLVWVAKEPRTRAMGGELVWEVLVDLRVPGDNRPQLAMQVGRLLGFC